MRQFEETYSAVVAHLEKTLPRPPAVSNEPMLCETLLGKPLEGDSKHFSAQAVVHKPRYLFCARLLGSLPVSGGRLLDIGASPFSFILSELLGFQVTVADMAEHYRDILTGRGIGYHHCDITEGHLPFEDKTFQVINFEEVMEHLPIDPRVYLREFRRALRDDGYLLLTTPNVACLKNRLRLALGFNYSCMFGPDAAGGFGHIREYTWSEAAQILDSAGFRIDTRLSGYRMYFDDTIFWAGQGLLPQRYTFANAWRLPLLLAYQTIVRVIPPFRYAMCFVCAKK